MKLFCHLCVRHSPGEKKLRQVWWAFGVARGGGHRGGTRAKALNVQVFLTCWCPRESPDNRNTKNYYNGYASYGRRGSPGRREVHRRLYTYLLSFSRERPTTVGLMSDREGDKTQKQKPSKHYWSAATNLKTPFIFPQHHRYSLLCTPKNTTTASAPPQGTQNK